MTIEVPEKMRSGIASAMTAIGPSRHFECCNVSSAVAPVAQQGNNKEQSLFTTGA